MLFITFFKDMKVNIKFWVDCTTVENFFYAEDFIFIFI